jgi:oxygen-independent coproporphyrinogen-3 oxidase
MHLLPTQELIAKYNQPVPRYTSYPPANYFQANIHHLIADEMIVASNEVAPEAISLYIHVPFCPQICHFCACNSCLSPQKSEVEAYFTALKQELIHLAGKLRSKRPVKQVHWGGGTPNGVAMHYLSEVMEVIFQNFKVASDAEIALEAHPGYLDGKQLKTLKKLEFTRLSLGIQDINHQVLDTIHRRKPKLSLSDLIEKIKQLGFRSLNADLVYGLPGQTYANFIESVKSVTKLRPDRIVTFSYAHVPWVKGSQNQLDKVARIEGNEKLQMFVEGKSILNDAGYVALGLDHFALPHDPLVSAYEKNQLHRNFMGYALKEQTGQVYGVGASAISQLGLGYLQNERNYRAYTQLMQQRGNAYTRGYKLSHHEQIIGKIITQIMCNGQLHWEDMAKQTNTSIDELKQITQFNPDLMQEFAQEDLISYASDSFSLKSKGWFFVRNIAALFDPLYQQNTKHFSNSI